MGSLMNEELHLLLETERHAHSSKCGEVDQLKQSLARERSRRLSRICSPGSAVFTTMSEANRTIGTGESAASRPPDLMQQIWQASSQADGMQGSSDEEDLDDGLDLGLDRLNRAESPLQGKIPRNGSQAQTQATVQASRKPSRSSVRSIPSEGVHHVSRTASSMASIEEETVDWLDHPDNVKSINCSAGHESGGTSTWWTANDSP